MSRSCSRWARSPSGRSSIYARGSQAAKSSAGAGVAGEFTAPSLASAESALVAVAEMAPEIADPDLAAGIELGRVCLAYLQGWKDSARDSLLGIEPALQRARWRSRLVLPLIALTLEARRQQRPEDMAAMGKLATALAAKGGTQAELAAHCADPNLDISGNRRAGEVRYLLAEAVKA